MEILESFEYWKITAVLVALLVGIVVIEVIARIFFSRRVNVEIHQKYGSIRAVSIQVGRDTEVDDLIKRARNIDIGKE